jgi:hypothetical protein
VLEKQLGASDAVFSSVCRPRKPTFVVGMPQTLFDFHVTKSLPSRAAMQMHPRQPLGMHVSVAQHSMRDQPKLCTGTGEIFRSPAALTA